MRQLSEEKRYIGITIGPIYDTLMLTSTPAGLWGASYLFSTIARELCIKLGRIMELITPYFDANDSLFHDRTGIGLFPDHLIFLQGEAQLADIRAEVDNVIEYAAGLLSPDGSPADPAIQAYYREYLQIHVLPYGSARNAIMDSTGLMDCAELERSFPVVEEVNPILASLEQPRHTLLAGVGGRNDAIKRSRLVTTTIPQGNWQLLSRDGSIRTLEEIAGNGMTLKDRFLTTADVKLKLKKFAYYAIVQADGDNMSKVIAACEDDKSIKDFSKGCMQYAASAADEVQAYGGTTIYAGGDDLLFIVPVENSKGMTLFELLTSLQSKFKQHFEGYKTIPTLSFGVAICYHKYPLYEAFSLAQHMLFSQAKQKAGKNAIALTLQKHSGQCVELWFTNADASLCLERFKALLRSLIDSDTEEKLLSSAVEKLQLFEPLFATAIHEWVQHPDSPTLENVFENTFDADMHSAKGAAAYLKGVKGLIRVAQNCITPIDLPEHLDEGLKQALTRLHATEGMLRLMKFYLERGSEDR